MAKAELDVLFTGLKGHLGNVVYYNMWGRTYVRRYVVPANPNSEAQSAQRSLFARGMAAWKMLTDDEKLLYKKKARNLKRVRRRVMHAHNLFISEYIESEIKARDAGLDSVKIIEPVSSNNSPAAVNSPCISSEPSLYGRRISRLYAGIQLLSCSG